MMAQQPPGRADRTAAARAKGRWRAWRWWLLRRAAQLGLLAVFLLGPWAGIWWVQGTLASSLWFGGLLPLTDPYVALQAVLARHALAWPAIAGALTVAAFYLLAGGRLYCGWVCPLNLVTDAAYALRQRLGIQRSWAISRHTRWWLLGATLLASAGSGVLAWEMLNPVTLLHRGLLFGMGAGWLLILAVFVLDVAVARRGWCGHVCPVGAFYGVLGRASRLRVQAQRRSACSQCGSCLRGCPEPHVIAPALKAGPQAPGFVTSGDCLRCGACIDLCPHEVFRLGWQPLVWQPQANARTE